MRGNRGGKQVMADDGGSEDGKGVNRLFGFAPFEGVGSSNAVAVPRAEGAELGLNGLQFFSPGGG